MAALKRAEALLSDPDPSVALRAATAISQLATSVVKLVEVAELQERVELLEAKVEGRAIPLGFGGGRHVEAEA